MTADTSVIKTDHEIRRNSSSEDDINGRDNDYDNSTASKNQLWALGGKNNMRTG